MQKAECSNVELAVIMIDFITAVHYNVAIIVIAVNLHFTFYILLFQGVCHAY